MICCWSCGSSNVGRPELETLMPFARRKRTDRHPTPASDPSWLLPTPFQRESLFQFYSFCLMTRDNAKNSSPNHPDCANFQESMGGAAAPLGDLKRYWRPVSGSGPVTDQALGCTLTNDLAMVARALTGFLRHANFDEAFKPLHVSGSRSVLSTESFRDSHDPWSRTGARRPLKAAWNPRSGEET